jgi:hypothetical protein
LATEGSAQGRSAVITEILRYLVEHPDAKDTIEGIARWWIQPQRPEGDEWKRDLVQGAMDELVARGWVVRRAITPSNVVYGLDKQHLTTITNRVRSESADDART